MVIGGHTVQNDQNQSNEMVLGGHMVSHNFSYPSIWMWVSGQSKVMAPDESIFCFPKTFIDTKTLSTISHSFEYYYLQYLCIQNAISDQINKKFEKGWTQLWINIKRVLFVWICFSFPTNLSLTLLIPGIRLLLSCL